MKQSNVFISSQITKRHHIKTDAFWNSEDNLQYFRHFLKYISNTFSRILVNKKYNKHIIP